MRRSQNAAGAAQVFAVEANGSGLRQLTSQVGGPTIVSWDVESGPTSDDVIRGACVARVSRRRLG